MPAKKLITSTFLNCLRRGADLTQLNELEEREWQELLVLGSRHFVSPLLFQRLVREQTRLKLPAFVSQHLRTSYYLTLATNQIYYTTLTRALQVLNGAGVRVLLLKGAYLAAMVYSDIGLRPMADLDVLVPEEDITRSIDLLKSAGFTAEREFWPTVDRSLHFHAPPLEKDGIRLELHWSLSRESYPVRIDRIGLWQRAQKIMLEDGEEAWTMGLADLMLYLCIHASYNHNFNTQLRSIVDIAEVIHANPAGIDWEAVVQNAFQWNAGRGAYLTLRLTQDLLGAEIPQEALTALEPPGFALEVLDWAIGRLFQIWPLSARFNHLMRGQSFGERLGALTKALFPSRWMMARRYHTPPASWRIWFLYPRHIFIRINGYGGHTWRMLRGDPQKISDAESDIALLNWLGIKG